MRNVDQLVENVVRWAEDKGIYDDSTSEAQFGKLMEEAIELHKALVTGNKAEIIDAIGDCQVVLINIAELEELDYIGCLSDAYDVISKRTGQMIDGVFVKDV